MKQEATLSWSGGKAAGVAALILLAGAQAWAQKWTLGALVGYPFDSCSTVRQGAGSGRAGIASGGLAGVEAGQDLYEHLGGEFRYLFRFSDLKVSAGASQVRFAGRSHLAHYDLLLYARVQSARARPYVAIGGGVRLYQGTGEEAAFQPLSRYAILTRTRQLTGMGSFGGGIKMKLGARSWLRFEMRDYLTPFPKTVIAPGPGAQLGKWLHDLAPMAAIGVNF